MLNDEICKLRDKLNRSIENGEDYDIIYKLSIELDELIAQYYKIDINNVMAWLKNNMKKSKKGIKNKFTVLDFFVIKLYLFKH